MASNADDDAATAMLEKPKPDDDPGRQPSSLGGQKGLTLEDLTKEQRAKLYQEFGLWEKGFTIGAFNIFFAIFLIARWPEFFWCFHTLKAFVYLPWRFVRFRARNLEWFMLDFCYANTYAFVICGVLTFLRVFFGIENFLHAYNEQICRAGFAFANGAMLLSIVMFGNKIVFHDVDSNTGFYIHFSPAIMMWTLRWGGGYGPSRVTAVFKDMFMICSNPEGGDVALHSLRNALWYYTDDCRGTIVDFTLFPLITWFVVWGIPYYLVIFLCFKDYLTRNGKKTLYTNTVEDKVNGALIRRAPEALRPLAYMLQHLAWSIFTSLISTIMWHSFILHTLYLLGIFLVALHNGSTFIFRVVAARHVNTLFAKTVEKDEEEGAGAAK